MISGNQGKIYEYVKTREVFLKITKKILEEVDFGDFLFVYLAHPYLFLILHTR